MVYCSGPMYDLDDNLINVVSKFANEDQIGDMMSERSEEG